jgi:hypothetical protein
MRESGTDQRAGSAPPRSPTSFWPLVASNCSTKGLDLNALVANVDKMLRRLIRGRKIGCVWSKLGRIKADRPARAGAERW